VAEHLLHWAVADRHAAGDGEMADDVGKQADRAERVGSATFSVGIISSEMERCVNLDVLSMEMEFREERDSHRSRSGGVMPACRGPLPQNR